MSVPITLPGCGKELVVSGMAIKHLEVLKSARQRGRVQEVLISEVICNLSSNLTEEEFKGLHLGDESTIMWGLLRATKGDSIEFQAECPHCESEAEYTANLAQMKIKKREQDETQDFQYKMADGTVLIWHLPIVEERILAAEEAKIASENSKGMYDFEMTFNLAMYIDEIVGQTEELETQKEKRKYIAKYLLEASINFPQDFLADVEEKNFGVDTEIEIVCSTCRKTYEMEVPVLQSFFTLGKKKRKEKKSLI